MPAPKSPQSIYSPDTVTAYERLSGLRIQLEVVVNILQKTIETLDDMNPDVINSMVEENIIRNGYKRPLRM
jgi:hypothetical protein